MLYSQNTFLHLIFQNNSKNKNIYSDFKIANFLNNNNNNNNNNNMHDFVSDHLDGKP